MKFLGPHPFIAAPLLLFAVSLLGAIYYDLVCSFAYKFGTRRRGIFTRFRDWTFRKLLPSWQIDDFGKFRSKAWRESHK
jgi:hypothetical protein